MSATPSSAESLRAGWYAVGVLWLGYICSFVDRQVLALLIEPIKQTLAIGDTQVSLLQGLAFGLFYALMGLPCGLLIDRYSRRAVIAGGVLLWSLATIACGFAVGFWMLFVARMLVGVGEATLSPGALSMLSDHFPRERRVLPISIYVSAGSFGGGLAMIAGGAAIAWATAHPYVLPGGAMLEGWRATFVMVGLPGLLIAALLLTVREPARRNEGGARARGTHAWSAAWVFMVERRALFLRHYGAFALFAWLAYAMLSWAPTYFIRVHGWTLPEAGWRFGLVYLVGGFSGAIFGGLFAAALRRRGVVDANLRAAGWGCTLIVPFVIAAPLMANPWLALALLGVAIFFTSFPSGASVTAISEVTPSALRGQVSAMYYLVMSFVGLAAGPLSVALCTDYLFHDPKRVGDSMALVSAVIGPLAALLLWPALPHFRRWASTGANDAPDALGIAAPAGTRPQPDPAVVR
jgi:MFS family permease